MKKNTFARSPPQLAPRGERKKSFLHSTKDRFMGQLGGGGKGAAYPFGLEEREPVLKDDFFRGGKRGGKPGHVWKLDRQSGSERVAGEENRGKKQPQEKSASGGTTPGREGKKC